MSEPKIFKCVPVDFLFIPKPYRIMLGKILIAVFGLLFLTPALGFAFFLIPFIGFHPILQLILISFIISFIIPYREWKYSRKIHQLMYEAIDFHTNFDPERIKDALKYDLEGKQYIIAAHPHGVIPFPGPLWAAFCDQYLSTSTQDMYGFGAGADVVFYVPFLRNILGWATTTSATYSVLKKGLTEGIVPPAPGRKVRHLFILPGLTKLV